MDGPKTTLPTVLKKDLKIRNLMFDSHEDLLKPRTIAKNRASWKNSSVCIFKLLLFNLVLHQNEYNNIIGNSLQTRFAKKKAYIVLILNSKLNLKLKD